MLRLALLTPAHAMEKTLPSCGFPSDGQERRYSEVRPTGSGRGSPASAGKTPLKRGLRMGKGNAIRWPYPKIIS